MFLNDKKKMYFFIFTIEFWIVFCNQWQMHLQNNVEFHAYSDQCHRIYSASTLTHQSKHHSFRAQNAYFHYIRFTLQVAIFSFHPPLSWCPCLRRRIVVNLQLKWKQSLYSGSRTHTLTLSTTTFHSQSVADPLSANTTQKHTHIHRNTHTPHTHCIPFGRFSFVYSCFQSISRIICAQTWMRTKNRKYNAFSFDVLNHTINETESRDVSPEIPALLI